MLCLKIHLPACREHCPRYRGGGAPGMVGFRLQKQQFDGTEVVSDVGSCQVGMGGWRHDPGTEVLF